MKTLNLKIQVDQGADFSLVVGVFNESGPINLTGYNFKGQVRSTTDPNGVSLAEFDFEVLNQLTDKGQVKWSLPIAEIDDLVTSTADASGFKRLVTPFLFDVKMQDTDEYVTRIMQGIFEVSPQATQEDFSGEDPGGEVPEEANL